MTQITHSKRVVACDGCGNLRRYSHTYKVRIELHPVVNGMRMPLETREGRICSSCAEQAGYKVKKGVKNG